MHHSIELYDIHVKLGDVTVLSGVSVEAKPYEFVSLVGGNGTGKTTLLKVANGMLRPFKGIVKMVGHELWQGANGNNGVRKEIGFVPQRSVSRHFPMRVDEAVLMGRYGKIGLMRKPSRQDWDRTHEALEIVGMTGFAAKLIHELSGGEQQKVALARALAQEPSILLLDEPTTYLDADSQSEIMETIHRMHQERGLTTLLVTHDPHWVEQYSNKVYLLKEGKSHLIRQKA
ncbi:MAG TPA: ATP-binding cassette domain-containing protein [Syntrophorhabdales bacterium]|nr:ATP-binding cassette domain-containing protein [Syntrophorhabdales bacterium]